MRQAGKRVAELVLTDGIRPRELVTRKSLENAASAVAATGGSTNLALHLPAIAHEAGIQLTLDDIGAVFDRTPLLADLKPGGRYWALDAHQAGGVPTLLRAMGDAVGGVVLTYVAWGFGGLWGVDLICLLLAAGINSLGDRDSPSEE